MGAIQFIENLDRTVLNISDEEFERNVEAAVSAMAERDTSSALVKTPPPSDGEIELHTRQGSDWERTMKPSIELGHPQQLVGRDTAHLSEENATARGILGTIQRPLSSFGRIFTDDTSLPATALPDVGTVEAFTMPSPRHLQPAPLGARQGSNTPAAEDGTYEEQSSPQISFNVTAPLQQAEPLMPSWSTDVDHRDIVE